MTTRSSIAPDLESLLAKGSRDDAPATSASTDGANARPGTARTPRVSRVARIRWLHSSRIDADLALALELADAADRITMARFRASDLIVDRKPDLTFVTEADRAVEAAVRERLADVHPGDAVVGEEYGATGSSSRRWIVDPIDGTHGYARGIPVWGTLIALERDGVLSVGVMSAPALGTRWWGTLADGAFRDGTPARVSEVTRLADAHLACEGPPRFELVGRGAQIVALERRCWRTRGFGDFWPYAMVADGSIDIAVEPQGLSLWDLAAPMVVVQAAGGTFTDLDGEVRADGGSAVATNGRLHDDVLAALAPSGAASGEA
jgi:histidinol-phosphatase